MRVDSIVKYMVLLVGIVVLLWGLYRAQVFLIPLTFGAVFSMLLLPASAKLEDWGCSRLWSSLAATLLFVAAIIGVLLLLSGLATHFAEQLPTMKQKALGGYREFQQIVEERWGIVLPSVTALQNSDKETGNATAPPKEQPPAEQEGSGQSNLPGGISAVAGTIIQFIRGIVEMLGSALLAIVSTFALLIYRGKFREFMLRLFSGHDRDKAQDIIDRSSRVGLHYLWGQILLVFVLAGLYAAGFLLIGLENAFLLAVFTAVFSSFRTSET